MTKVMIHRVDIVYWSANRWYLCLLPRNDTINSSRVPEFKKRSPVTHGSKDKPQLQKKYPLSLLFSDVRLSVDRCGGEGNQGFYFPFCSVDLPFIQRNRLSLSLCLSLPLSVTLSFTPPSLPITYTPFHLGLYVAWAKRGNSPD